MKPERIHLTAQNIDVYEGDGLDPFARTGATTAEQVHKAGAEGVILGHSEVGDSPEVVRKKLLTIISKSPAHGNGFLKRITLLVGETWDEFGGNTAEAVAEKVSEHLLYILEGVPSEFVSGFVIGYEPKWGSRGSGRDDMSPPGKELISTVCKRLRLDLVTSLGEELGNSLPIIYGGRSTPERTEEILADENVEGLILGSACSTVKKTMDIANAIAKARGGKRKILHANFKVYELPDSYSDYLKELQTLDDDFIVYLSPPDTDLRELKNLL